MTVGRGKFREDRGHGLAVLSKEKGGGEKGERERVRESHLEEVRSPEV